MGSQNPPERSSDPAARERYKRHLDRLLDEALEETFPASDPVAVTPRRRKAPVRPNTSVGPQGR